MVEEEVPDNLAATVSKRRRELIGTCTYIVHVYVYIQVQFICENTCTCT